MDSVTTAITEAVADFAAASPAVIAAGVSVGVIVWGAPKLFRLFKRTTG